MGVLDRIFGRKTTKDDDRTRERDVYVPHASAVRFLQLDDVAPKVRLARGSEAPVSDRELLGFDTDADEASALLSIANSLRDDFAPRATSPIFSAEELPADDEDEIRALLSIARQEAAPTQRLAQGSGPIPTALVDVHELDTVEQMQSVDIDMDD